MKLLFFILFYVIVGTTGITIPILIDHNCDIPAISIGLITIVVSTVGYNASEKIMELVDLDSKKKKIDLFLNLVAIVVVLLLTTVICISVSKQYKADIWIAGGAYIFSCIFWWFQNWNNKNFEVNPTDAMGGKI
jgi:uncharacterized membrane protein